MKISKEIAFLCSWSMFTI